MIAAAVVAIILFAMSYYYLQVENDLILILIPLLSLLSQKFVGKIFKTFLVGLFVLFFFVSSFLLYVESIHYKSLGVLSFIFFVSLVIISFMEYGGGKND
jgi:hypothetical protein